MVFRVAVQILFAGVLASTTMMTTRAQNPAQTQAPTQADQQRGIDPDFENRQRDMRLFNKTMNPSDGEKKNAPKRRDPKVVMAEITEDFTRLQEVNNDLGQAVSKPGPLNLEFVIKSVAELMERSQRFSDNLGHPEPDKNSKLPKLEPLSDVEQLKHALTDLGKLIDDFAHNPLFTDPTTRNAESLVKARRDLVEIHTQSDQIKKSAEQLSKAATGKS